MYLQEVERVGIYVGMPGLFSGRRSVCSDILPYGGRRSYFCVYGLGDFDYETGKFDYYISKEIDWGLDYYAPPIFLKQWMAEELWLPGRMNGNGCRYGRTGDRHTERMEWIFNLQGK